MRSYAVELQRLDSVPLAVIRRQARASELARVVPECCGLVWDAVRAQQAQAGRHVAIYWDGSIRLEVGVEVYGTRKSDPSARLRVLRYGAAGLMCNTIRLPAFAKLRRVTPKLAGTLRAAADRMVRLDVI